MLMIENTFFKLIIELRETKLAQIRFSEVIKFSFIHDDKMM